MTRGMIAQLALLLGATGAATAQELVCVTPHLCVPWEAACIYAKAYCIDGQGSSCGAIGHLCERREDENWCGAHSVFERCWAAGPECEAQCGTLDLPAHCVKARAACEASRCVCSEGFRRTRTGECVPAYQCQRCRWSLVPDAVPVDEDGFGRRKLAGRRLDTISGTAAEARHACRLLTDCNIVLSVPFASLRILLAATEAEMENVTDVIRSGYFYHRKVCTLLKRN